MYRTILSFHLVTLMKTINHRNIMLLEGGGALFLATLSNFRKVVDLIRIEL